MRPLSIRAGFSRGRLAGGAQPRLVTLASPTKSRLQNLRGPAAPTERGWTPDRTMDEHPTETLRTWPDSDIFGVYRPR